MADDERFVLGVRYIPEIDADRAKLRTTLVYRFTDSFQAGVEYNPIGDDIGPLVNWRIVDEGRLRPALILGTSSDRIGTGEGRAIYATLSKSLESVWDLPVAPYAGVSFSTRNDEFLPVGGLSIFWTDVLTSQHLYDGRNIHHVLNWAALERLALGVVVAEQDGEYFPGVSLVWSFGF